MDRLATRTLSLVAALALALLALVVDPTPAAACDCGRQTTAQALNNADAVFRGTITEQHPVKKERIDLRVRVDTVYKGSVHADQVVATATDAAGCGLFSEVGGTWVFFALEGTEGEGDEAVNRLITGSCSGNLPADRPASVLGTGEAPLPGSSDREERSERADRRLSRAVVALGVGVLSLGALAAVGLAVLWRPGRRGPR